MRKWILLNEINNQVEFSAKGEVFDLACCDCGLVHRISIILEKNGNIGMAFKRNQKLTEKNRMAWKKRPR